MKGLALQANLAYGGMFNILQGIDPFENAGMAQPSLVPTLVSTSTLINFLRSGVGLGVGNLYGHSATKFYQILNSAPFTVTDKTSSLSFASAPTGSIVWTDPSGTPRYIYGLLNNGIRSWNFNVTDVNIFAGFNGGLDYNPFCVGPDKNCYFGDNAGVGKLVLSSGSAGNTGFATFPIEGDMNVRDIVTDGQYLIIIADNNATTLAGRVPGKFRCRVYFWDMDTTDTRATKIWDFDDSYLIAGAFLDGSVYIFGYNGLYVCSIGTAPKMIRPFVGSSTLTITGRPINPSQVAVNRGSIYWLDGSAIPIDSRVYAYGNPVTGQQKIFYQPYGNYGYSNLAGAICPVGTNLFATDATEILVYNVTGNSRGASRVVPAAIIGSSPHKFEYTKVVLAQPLSSGQSVTHNALSQNGTIVSGNETKSYSAANPKQTLMFRRIASANSPERFEELIPSVITAGGPTIERIATYATPLDDSSEDL